MTTSAIKELDDLIKKNPHLNIGQMNFQSFVTLSKLKGSKKSKAKALPHLLALQRLYRTVNEPKIAKKLLKKGLDSAADIAALTEEEFVARYAKAFSGNKEQAARKAHRTARARHAQALLHAIERKQKAEPHYQASWFSDETPSNKISLEDSNQASSTETSEPRYSVLSPRAYFLELKKFKNNNLTGNPKYPFTERRPDIEKLSPQTPHIEEEVPYLNVVNEVLEEQIPKTPYEQLAEAKYPFNLPFNLPLTKTHHYLHYLKTDLPTLYQSFAKEIKPEITARDYLKLSTKEYEYLATPVSTQKELNPFYGLESGANPVQILSTVNTFLEKTGLTRDELQTLLFQNLHPAEIEAGIAGQFFINTTKENSKTYIIIVEEGGLEKLKLKTLGSTELKPLTLEHLDRLNRFIRLARKIGWSFTELNWVITSSCQNKLDQDKLDQEALTRIAAIKHLQEITQQPLDLLCSFWADLKSIGLGDKPAFQFEDLFDRTFNSRVAQEHKSYLPQNQDTWLKKLYETAGATPYNKVDEHWKPRLAAALGIDRTDVDRIEEYLKLEAPIQTPNLQNLSLLFRYAKISQALNLSVEDFLLLLDLIREDKTLLVYNPFPLFMDRKPKDKVDTHALLKGTAAPRAENLPQTLWLVELLISIVQWLKTENLTVPQLSYLKTGQLHRSVKPLLDQEQHSHLFQQLHHEFQNILVTPHSFESENVTPAEAQQIFGQLLAGKYIDKNGLVLKTEPPRYPGTFNPTNFDKTGWIKDRPPVSTHGTESLNFNRKDTYIDCGNIDLTNSFTIEFWAKQNEIIGRHWIISKEGKIDIYFESVNLMVFELPEGVGNHNKIFSHKGTDKTWRHWAMVYDKTNNKQYIYQDGQAVEGNTTATNQVKDKPLFIGRPVVVNEHARLFSGQIAEVRIWNRARSKDQIKTYKNRGLVGNEEGLLNYQPLGSNIYIYTKLQTLAKRQAQTLFKGLGTSHHVTSLNLIQTLSRIASSKSSDQEIVALVMTPILEGKTPSDPFFDTFQHYVSLFQQLKLGEREAQILLTKPNCFHIADIKKLAISHLKTVTALRQLAVTFDHPNHPLIGYFESKPEEATKILAEITEWKKNEIDPLLERFFGKSDPPNPKYLQISALLKLKTCFDLSHQLGAEPSTLLKKVWEKAWLKSEERQKEDMAKALFSLLKAQTGEKERPALREALDQLINREKREALTGYVIHHLQTRTDKPSRPHIKTPRDLYNYLLIDVEMGEAARTSRLLEAISCLQLYIHRCRLHQEEGVTVKDSLEALWPIMKSYRLWEAKQRILFYPENYIKPELRQDKTPLFKTLEDDLQQTDITDTNVETAFKKYLDGFSEVAHLKIFGSHVYIDPAYPTDKMLILLGRSHTEPRKIYYRTARCLGSSPAIQWEPWEEIKLSIPAEQVYPVYAFGKIFIFWPEVKEEKSSREKARKPGEHETVYAHHAKLLYSFHNFNQGWSHPQQLGEKVQLQAWKTEPQSEPSWTRQLYPVYNAKTNQELYLFYQEVSADDKLITYKNVLKILFNLDLEIIPGGSIPAKWIRNTLPKVLTQDPDKYYPITNQPNWFIFQAKGGTFLLKPDNYKPPLGNAINVGYPKPLIPPPFTNKKWAVEVTSKSLIKMNHSPGPFPKKNITLEGWIFTSSTNRLLFISSENQYDVILSYSKLIVNIKKQKVIEHDFKMPEQWIHMAVTRDDDKNNVVVYLNGHPEFDSSRTNAEVIETNTPMFLAIPAAKSFLISEVRIWNVTRSEAEIKKAMNKELTGEEPGLIGYWRLDEGQGTEVYPFNNRGVEGVFQGNVTWICFKSIAISSEIDYQPDEKTLFDIVRLTSNAVSTLSHNLLTGGMKSLLKLTTQEIKELPAFAEQPSKDQIGYNANLVRTVPSSQFLGFNDADGIYYWEIFFHGPFLLADRLNTAQHFNQAQAWYQHIFNPTIKANPWQFLPLREAHQKNDVVNNEAALVAFAENPFDPQSIAQTRPIAFKKAIGMRYIDTLIDHGDSLFRRYTYETIVEATLYYIMAYDLLGPQPVRQTSLLSQTKASNGSSPASLEQEILSFENGTNGDLNLLNQALDDPHFFLPENTYFLGYWDRVQDRLYKIRHSLNIDGVRQSLPLFQPSIDPAALLKRSANGLTDDSPLSPLAHTLLPYRFTIVLAKAQNLAAQVTQFGSALLSALEKKDAEALALLRNTQESALLKMTRSMKESQIEASKETVQSLTAGLAQATARQKYYTQLLNAGLSPAEISQIVNMSIAQVFNILSGITRTAAAAGHIIPENAIMAGLTPNVITSFGGTQIGGALSAISSNLGIVAEQFSFAANMSSLIGGFQRRAQEWELQKTLATHDITQIERQIESAKWQQKIAERDLEVLDKNIEQNTEIDSFLADKFTNHELYQWMAGKLTGIYFQSFQMAHDLSLSAQRAFQFELTNNATFIDSSYWDGLKKGLLAGEILQVDLNRMEKAYLERNVRRFEIEKTVSLFELDPKALLNLKRTGTCDLHLTELLFNRDFPGHYSRQIKNISVSFPAVVGPYQNIYATLSQRVHRTLIEADIGGVKFLLGVKEDQPTTIRQDWRQNQRVALSRGLDDSGLFQLNFQDERYLPFEGTGAVSSWNLELNQNSINLNNLTDVIIKIEYTALTGDETFKQSVKDTIKDLPETKTQSRLFLIAQEFGDAWRQFLATNTENKTLTLFLKKSMFLALTDPNPNLTAIYLQLELTEEGKEAVKKKPTITLKVGTHDKTPLNFDTDGVINKEGLKLNSFQEVDWTFTDNNKFFTDKHVKNMALLVTYGAKTEGNETRIFSGGTTRGGVRQSEHKLVVPRAKNKVAVKKNQLSKKVATRKRAQNRLKSKT